MSAIIGCRVVLVQLNTEGISKVEALVIVHFKTNVLISLPFFFGGGGVGGRFFMFLCPFSGYKMWRNQ